MFFLYSVHEMADLDYRANMPTLVTVYIQRKIFNLLIIADKGNKRTQKIQRVFTFLPKSCCLNI
jgi:hypothetical protein